MEINKLLTAFTEAAKDCFAEKLTGVYLHGSLAMDCFREEISDVDLLVVVQEELTNEEKDRFLGEVVRLNDSAPKKGIEMSVVYRKDMNPFIYPTPFCLHFSPMHIDWFKRDRQGYVQHMNGLDKDLGSHCRVICQRGVTLWGEEIAQVFGSVPDAAYLDSILCDVEEAPETMENYPVSTILNLCRTLAFIRDKACFSKKEGGQWGVDHLSPALRPLVLEALCCYDAGKPMSADLSTALRFAETMLEMIHEEKP